MNRTRRGAGGGFTLIEVMASLGVMMVGVMAVITLQQQTIRANVHARELTVAMQIAQRVMERLKQDAHGWTTVGTNLTGTALLGAGMVGQPTAFKTLPTLGTVATGDLVSNAFDRLGRDVLNTGTDYVYCASYRPAWIWTGQLMRTDVRVWWARDVARPDGTQPNITGAEDGFAQCVDNNSALNPGGGQFPWYHVVYLSGALRVTEVRR